MHGGISTVYYAFDVSRPFYAHYQLHQDLSPLKETFCIGVTRYQGLSRLCVQHVIWTPRTLFSDSLDTQKSLSEFADDDFSEKIEDVEVVVSLL